MGEARQRQLAKAAGKPWDVDKPKPPEPRRYLGVRLVSVDEAMKSNGGRNA